MRIIGCDLHARQQTVEPTGEPGLPARLKQLAEKCDSTRTKPSSGAESPLRGSMDVGAKRVCVMTHFLHAATTIYCAE